ncbi:MAG: glutaminyl-tRNA synthase (glutamine-hydrolyzing) subunit B [Candidatus Handelsmanbacteria bacterium RIFCSPLOWO2_12_FULL_64_10]|uniref:Aspartyl/glutamyl-tRNA(Asn/Gln) amidotransferase subunit B n=1 Tax=Handelsmanbacteria sp. (strain RIFCSPLOWO2_12_FULL_64_10) TaxID=1817868 RepID=A0A1F6CLC5_HANXR|nr:MAG: glutaminyl-tRNA synthase (glutamine-hydrolyzing) subunit B [Candidatus Handelsmanbacteria bacterium RIFCSPLOWO2_12_FULL_64_10]
MRWEAVIGLETHVQLATRSKLFCGCTTAFGSPPNTQTCPVCLGLPGALPVLNRAAFELAVRAALALGAEIPSETRFDRKHYFYPDLPKGYQISQLDRPFSRGGGVTLDDGSTIRLRRVHLEEDAGKLVHAAERSAVDLNRAGVPLIEVVTEPELRSAAQAHAYLTALKAILRAVGVSGCDMEKGELRCDVNVSLRPAGADALGVKAEIKNLNSFRYAVRAIEAEIRRQAALLDGGGRVAQETLLYDVERDATAPMRSKEEAHDYRYFPEPDLRPVSVDAAWVERVRASLPELPRARRDRFVREFGLAAYDAGVLVADGGLADFFEAVPFADKKVVANWVTNDLLRLDDRSRVTPEALGELLGLLSAGTITGATAKRLLRETAETGRLDAAGMEAVSDLDAAAEAVVAEHARPAAEFRAGKEKALQFLIGQLMRRLKGRADPAAAAEALKRALTR